MKLPTPRSDKAATERPKPGQTYVPVEVCRQIETDLEEMRTRHAMAGKLTVEDVAATIWRMLEVEHGFIHQILAIDAVSFGAKMSGVRETATRPRREFRLGLFFKSGYRESTRPTLMEALKECCELANVPYPEELKR